MADKKNILIVDDGDFLSKILRSKLGETEFIVDQVFNGAEALAHLATGKPDLIVLDLIMPKMSGFEFLEKISGDAAYAGIPIVVLSNLAQEADKKRAGDKIKAYLVKAYISMEEVVATIKKHTATP